MVKTPTNPLVTPSTPSTPSPLPEVSIQLIEPFPKQALWKRVAIGASCVTLGFTAIAIGTASLFYRLTHLTVDTGLINGRLIQLQAPSDGEVKAFYARHGAAVQSGQVLVRLAPSHQQEQQLLKLQGEVDAKTMELNVARQTLEFLRQQLQFLETQSQTMQGFSTEIATHEVSHQQADLKAAIAAETEARTQYNRYQTLQVQGVVSAQQVDQLRSKWHISQANVERAKAGLSSAQVSLTAAQTRALSDQTAHLKNQQLSLQQDIQKQTSLVNTLSTQLENSRQQLLQAQKQLSDRQDFQVSAPFSGVIYSTVQDVGSQVRRSDSLMSLLDCNDLWVEALLDASQSRQIDTTKPVRVQIPGEATTQVGEVEVIKAITLSELAKEQSQALLAAVPRHLVGKPLAKVTVRIPPTQQQTSSHHLCGVGQATQLTFNTVPVNSPQWLSRK